ncbi:MAG: VTT domain-containing protein [Actinomycetia bacterium]|nr:VTT domain-containing protein [Actinomycetes bacterium]
MQELTKDWPVWAVFIFFFCGAFARGNAMYWIGRAIRSGGAKSRWASLLERPGMAKAEHLVAKFGPPAVPLGHLTVGVQSAINITAGVLRMPQSRWLPAIVVGALLWAAIYTTVGLAILAALVGRVEWWWALIAVLVIGAIVLVSRRLSAQRAA